MRHYRNNWIICYDIYDARRLHRVYRLCCDHAATLQNSIFWAEFNHQEFMRFISLIEGVIDTAKDDVRIYPVGPLSQLQLFGQSRLPDAMKAQTHQAGNSLFTL